MATHWYVGPWIWEESGQFPRWRAPSGLHGSDLRSLPDQSSTTSSGQGIFCGPVGPLQLENRSNYTYLGSGSWRDLQPGALQKSAIASAAYGYAPRGDTLAAMMFDLLTGGSDPDGLAAVPPLVPTTDSLLEVHKFGSRVAVPFNWGGAYTPKLKALHRRVFKELFDGDQSAGGIRLVRKVLDFWQKKYNVGDWKEFVPQILQGDIPGPLPHETTITDNFNRVGGTLGTSSGGWSWSGTLESTDIGTDGSAAYFSGIIITNGLNRAETDLSSSDHYTQCQIGVDTAAVDADLTVLSRFDSSALTHYFFHVRFGQNKIEFYKRISGTYTQIGASQTPISTLVAAFYYTVKGTSNGSSLQIDLTGELPFSETDTAITGNTRTGLRWSVTNGNGIYFDNYQAADLAASAVPTYAPEVRLGPPLRGAPWRTRVLPQEESGTYGARGPFTPSPAAYAPEVRLGPPMRGAPWRGLLPFQEEGTLYGPRGAFTQSPNVYAPEIRLGPPIPGAPWHTLVVPQEGAGLSIQGIDDCSFGSDFNRDFRCGTDPPVIAPLAYAPEVRLGPPIPGAPWHTLVAPQDLSSTVGGPAAALPSPVVYAPEIRLGPPIPGAPWHTLIVPQELGNLYGPPAPQLPQAPQTHAPEHHLGPPMLGAPWLARLPFQEAAGLYGAYTPEPPVPAPLAYAPEIRIGPPMIAPWRQLVPIQEPTTYGARAPFEASPPYYAPELYSGPPLRGAPWLARLPIQESSSLLGRVILPGNRGGATVPATGKPFLPRVQERDNFRRLGRFTEKLSMMVNSLIGQGILVQTGQDDWQLRSGGFAMARPPTADDDVTIGASPGCSWVDTAAGKMWFCQTNTRGAAVWLGPLP